MTSWVLNDQLLDIKTNMTLGILNHLLIGNTSSDLYRNLMDNGLGTAVIGGDSATNYCSIPFRWA